MDTVLYAAIARVELGQLEPDHREMVLSTLEVWIVIPDMLKGFLNALATVLFSINLILYSRLGTGLGAAGILIAVVQFGYKLAYFPTHRIPPSL